MKTLKDVLPDCCPDGFEHCEVVQEPNYGICLDCLREFTVQ